MPISYPTNFRFWSNAFGSLSLSLSSVELLVNSIRLLSRLYLELQNNFWVRTSDQPLGSRERALSSKYSATTLRPLSVSRMCHAEPVWVAYCRNSTVKVLLFELLIEFRWSSIRLSKFLFSWCVLFVDCTQSYKQNCRRSYTQSCDLGSFRTQAPPCRLSTAH